MAERQPCPKKKRGETQKSAKKVGSTTGHGIKEGRY